jgi:hypothetical protein
MGFRVPGDERDTHDILVVGADEQLLTSLERQETMFGAGWLFEAAIARAAMLEGLLLHYLFCAKQIRNVTFDASTQQRLADERITFGQVKDALKNAGAFHDPQLQIDVEVYVGNRNRIAHHLAAGLASFELQEFFQMGRSIATRVWNHILRETEPHRRANP